MSIKKFLCGLLASMMLVATFASCTNGNTDDPVSDSGTGTETETDTPEETVNLPDEKFKNGSQVVFITRDNNEWSSTDIYSAGGGEDTISDAVLQRNELVRDRLGVEITEIKKDNSKTKEAVNQAISGGLSDYHAVVSSSQIAAQMASSGWLRDLNSMTIDYLDLTKSWWDNNLAEELSLGGHMYFATGDMMIMDNDATFCLLFNKTIREDNQKVIPDLYQMVDKYEWTMDKMQEYVALTADKSGNPDGQLGLLRTADTPFALYYGGGVKAVSKDTKTDTFEFTLDVRRADDVATKAKEIFSESFCRNLTTAGADVKELGQQYFGGGKAFLYGDVLQCVERMRAYDVDFGVIPYPLYDQNQTSYHHMMHVEGSVVSIPRSSSLKGETLEMVTATLEAMAYYSPKTLTRQYYDINLTSKYIDDPESAPMIDLILETRVYDLPYYFELTPDNITHLLAQCMLPGSATKASSAADSVGMLLENKISQLMLFMDKQAERFGE